MRRYFKPIPFLFAFALSACLPEAEPDDTPPTPEEVAEQTRLFTELWETYTPLPHKAMKMQWASDALADAGFVMVDTFIDQDQVAEFWEKPWPNPGEVIEIRLDSCGSNGDLYRAGLKLQTTHDDRIEEFTQFIRNRPGFIIVPRLPSLHVKYSYGVFDDVSGIKWETTPARVLYSQGGLLWIDEQGSDLNASFNAKCHY